MADILLAEDDEVLRQFLTKALKKAGHKVIDCADGGSAWRALQERDVDLLLTDIVMPEMDGIELARKATARRPELKVMFITGFAAVALNPESGTPQGAPVLSKPFHLRQLVAEVERLLSA
ncbi:MAG TPA: response regulator [Thermopetrobacter sp.]|nr:response regulator [Thermopetrobacter sp.]